MPVNSVFGITRITNEHKYLILYSIMRVLITGYLTFNQLRTTFLYQTCIVLITSSIVIENHIKCIRQTICTFYQCSLT